MIKFINLPDSFDLEVFEEILYVKRLEIRVIVSSLFEFKICCVPYNSRLLVRQFVYLSSNSDDFIILDGYVQEADLFKLLKNLKLHEND